MTGMILLLVGLLIGYVIGSLANESSWVSRMDEAMREVEKQGLP